eukprot:tig00021434_g21348.t1
MIDLLLEDLPDDLLRHSLRYTDLRSVLAFAAACRRFHSIVWAEGRVFLDVLSQRLGTDPHETASTLSHLKTELDWANELKMLEEVPDSPVFQERFHDDEVMTALWSPDGRLLASASKDGTVKVYQLEESGARGARRFALRVVAVEHVNDGRHARSTAWSPDGTMLMATDFDQEAGFSSIHIWAVGDEDAEMDAGRDEEEGGYEHEGFDGVGGVGGVDEPVPIASLSLAEAAPAALEPLEPPGAAAPPAPPASPRHRFLRKLLDLPTSRFDTCMWSRVFVDPRRPGATGIHYGTFHYASTAAVRSPQLVRGDLRPEDYRPERTVGGIQGEAVRLGSGPPEFSLVFTRGSTENDIDEIVATPYGRVEQRVLAHFDGQVSGLAISRDDRWAALHLRPFPPGRAQQTAALRARRELLGPRASAVEVGPAPYPPPRPVPPAPPRPSRPPLQAPGPGAHPAPPSSPRQVFSDPSINLGDDWEARKGAPCRTCPVSDGPPRLVLFDLRAARPARALLGREATSRPPFILLPDFQGPRPYVIKGRIAYHACGSEDGAVWVWHRDLGAPARVLRRHSACVNQVNFNPREPRLLATASDDFSIALFWPASCS